MPQFIELPNRGPADTSKRDSEKGFAGAVFFVRDAKSGESTEEPKMLSFSNSDWLKIGFPELSGDRALIWEPP